jgi:hypothetical protein
MARIPRSGERSIAGAFDETNMAVATQPVTPRVRPRHVLLVGAFVVGWSVGRGSPGPASTAALPPEPLVAPPPPAEATPPVTVPPLRGHSRLRRPARLALAGTMAVIALAGAGLAVRADDARAPLVDPAVAAREHAQAVKQAETARLHLLRRLQLAGITARRVGPPDPPPAAPAVPKQPVVQPSERAIALDNYLQALGTQTILTGLDASRDQLQQQVLSDPRVSIYPGGRSDVGSGRIDVRVLAIIEYLAQSNGQVSVSCLIAGHSRYVHGRPGVVSAHIYGRAVDISAVGNVSILGHQGPGSVTERTIRQILALPPSVEPAQVISLMSLGGPSFALSDHYNHIHIGY